MRFNVGPYRYRVVIVSGLCDENGDELLGLCVPTEREIRLNYRLAGEQRREVMFHELRHAWGFHVPQARNAEEDANLFAMMSDQLQADLDALGGNKAIEELWRTWTLENFEQIPAEEIVPETVAVTAFEEPIRYTPVDMVEESQTPALAGAIGTSCGRCDTKIAEGSIVTGDVKHDPFAGGKVVSRAAFCPCCHHVMRWVEGCLPNGAPNNSAVTEPEYIRGREVEIFLAKFPHAVGMSVT